MSQTPKKPGEVFWPKIVLKKWLNIRANDSEFSADEGGNESGLEEDEENCGCEGNEERRTRGLQAKTNDDNLESFPYKLRRRNSETLRSQYINTKELRVCVGTWNVGGQHPPEDLDIAEWLDTEEPADIYALGIQEIVPLNAGNIFGAEDSGPVAKWEHLIRKTLNRIQPIKPKYKCYSDPPSPSRFKPSEDVHFTVDELLSETNSDTDDDDEISTSSVDSKGPVASYLDHGESNIPQDIDQNMPPTLKRLQRLNHFTSFDYDVNSAATTIQEKKLLRTLSTSERIGLIWPEQPLDLLAKHALSNSTSFRSIRSFRTYNSFKPVHSKLKDSSEVGLVPDLDLNVTGFKKKRLDFVRIISKQMVGIYLSIWVRRSVRNHIQNLKVSTVGVGVMGYIGNKGSISVSMSIYQTPFCFVCSHLSSGEKSGDELRRNSDVQEIHRRTQFSTVAGGAGLPKTIHDHERIFWLGDLNYRIDLSPEKTHELITGRNWTLLAERDQLKRELKKGRAFDGWSEGVMNFPPTYKYAFNSTNYVGDDQKGGRRNPAWCDRILSFGKGVRLLDYKRAELKLSDHRPVTAVFMAEVEVFCHRKLQKALTLTDAEVEDGGTMPDVDFTLEMGLGDDISGWLR